MIYLSSISKAFTSRGHPQNIVFMPSSALLPTQKRIAVLGGTGEGKSVLLRILAGVDAPDEGRVTRSARLSPIANTGAYFDLRMSVFDNFRYIARLYGMATETLILAAAHYVGSPLSLERPLGNLTPQARRLLDTAVVAILPFDCYLIDHVTGLEPGVMDRYVANAVTRNAGVIFATTRLYDVRQYADFAVVIRDKTLYSFDCINEATEFYDRKANQSENTPRRPELLGERGRRHGRRVSRSITGGHPE